MRNKQAIYVDRIAGGAEAWKYVNGRRVFVRPMVRTAGYAFPASTVADFERYADRNGYKMVLLTVQC
jgi:hypothetical protein